MASESQGGHWGWGVPRRGYQHLIFAFAIDRVINFLHYTTCCCQKSCAFRSLALKQVRQLPFTPLPGGWAASEGEPHRSLEENRRKINAGGGKTILSGFCTGSIPNMTDKSTTDAFLIWFDLEDVAPPPQEKGRKAIVTLGPIFGERGWAEKHI